VLFCWFLIFLISYLNEQSLLWNLLAFTSFAVESIGSLWHHSHLRGGKTHLQKGEIFHFYVGLCWFIPLQPENCWPWYFDVLARPALGKAATRSFSAVQGSSGASTCGNTSMMRCEIQPLYVQNCSFLSLPGMMIPNPCRWGFHVVSNFYWHQPSTRFRRVILEW